MRQKLRSNLAYTSVTVAVLLRSRRRHGFGGLRRVFER